MIQSKYRPYIKFILQGVLVLLSISCTGRQKGLWIETIQCDHKEQATGVSNTPSFSWILNSDEKDQRQTAYQLIVSENKTLLPDDQNVWNSEKVISGQSVGVHAGSLSLKPGHRYYWKVKVWDKNGVGSSWSETSSFITALFDEGDWQNAKWISYEEMNDSLILVPGIPTWGHNTREIATRRAVIPLFRKEFTAKKNVESALLFISGLGHYKAYLNETMVSDDFMSPGWTHYQKTCLYNTYDITKDLKQGKNAIGIIVGTGFYNINNERYRKLLITYGMPKVIAKLTIEYSDGSSETIVTDTDWKTSPSPITYSSIYGGENYNANLEQKGWNSIDFDDTIWQYAIAAKPPGGELLPEITYPVVAIKSFLPVDTIQKGIDTFAFDFGQNASAIIEISLKGNKGDTVRLYPSELLFEELRENQRWTGWPHYYEYILKGEGIETWSPMFTYYGMRFVHVTGAHPAELSANDNKPEIVAVKMHHVSNSSPTTGSFWCSNNLFNQIDTLIRYGIKSNMQSLLTDCPHRERLGWIEQTYLMGNSIKFNFDLYHLYSKLVRDMMDSQRKNGLIVNMAPEFIDFGDEFTDSPEWGSAIIQAPWLMYKWYGDIQLIENAWDSMLQYINYLDSQADNNIISYGLGDWYDLGPELPGFPQLSPIPTTATAIYYLDYLVMARMAELMKKNREAKLFNDKAEEIKSAYNKLLFNYQTGVYATGSQSSMTIPLSMGLVEDEYRKLVLNNLVDSILANDKRITAGDIGFHFLIDALTKGNHSQLIYEMNNRDDVPGYGYQIKKGATALTESWDALERKSNNHLMLGHLMEWFYTGLGGIRQKENSVAYKEIIIKPTLVEGLEEVKTSHQTPYGMIVSEWKNTEKELIMNIQIPVNTTAEIYIPSSPKDVIRENGTILEKSSSVEIPETTQSYSRKTVGSGKYQIRVVKY